MVWTDRHLIQALRDLFLGRGSFTALHQLRNAGLGARLIFTKPTSHTAQLVLSKANKVKVGPAGGVTTFIHASSSEAATEFYRGVFDHAYGGRLHLVTLFPDAKAKSTTIQVLAPGAGAQDKPVFCATF
jgi:hypothetical protein